VNAERILSGRNTHTERVYTTKIPLRREVF
jgi:hypothetical protein